MKKMFEGVKVLDVTNNLAGPHCTTMLADYGAEVIHIEKPVIGDDTRHLPPMIDKISFSYGQHNRGKKSLVLDMNDQRAKDAFLRLAKDVDIIVESNRPGVVKKLGIDYESIKKINPSVIYVSVSAYGQTGPLAPKRGYDLIAQAQSGLMARTGDPDATPYCVGSVVGDFAGAICGFSEICAAFYHRMRTGEGQFIDVSLVRTFMWLCARFDYLYGFDMLTRTGNHHPDYAPYGVFAGKNDEYIVLAVETEEQWCDLCGVIGNPELAGHPLFKTNADRVKNRDALGVVIETWIQTMDHIETVEQKLTEANVPNCKIYSMKDIDEDIHFNQNGWISGMPAWDENWSVTSRRCMGSPWTLSRIVPFHQIPPRLGEDNHEILERVGFTAEEVDAMEKEWAEHFSY